MRLYSCRFAPNPHKIRLAVAELGVPCDEVELNVPARENRQPPFLALNPNGHLPVIDDDGFVLWESDAILAYLGRKHLDRGLWPGDPRGEADALRWLFYELATLQPPAGEIWWERWLKPRFAGKPGDDAPVAKAMKELEKPLRVLDRHLAAREHMLGAFTLVDCAYAAVLNMLALGDVSLSAHPALAAYFARLRARPSFAACPFVFPGESR